MLTWAVISSSSVIWEDTGHRTWVHLTSCCTFLWRYTPPHSVPSLVLPFTLPPITLCPPPPRFFLYPQTICCPLLEAFSTSMDSFKESYHFLSFSNSSLPYLKLLKSVLFPLLSLSPHCFPIFWIFLKTHFPGPFCSFWYFTPLLFWKFSHSVS